MRNYPRLSIEDFGKHLLESGDLDPIYIALVGAGYSQDQLFRWLVAYWCFYHAGFACYASEFKGNHFWEVLKVAGANEVPAPTGGRWPRGHERRHFRGKIAAESLAELSTKYPHAPSQMVRNIVGGAVGDKTPRGFHEVAQRAKSHRGFGPWMAFKVADMVDRCLAVPVDFDKAAVFMFDDPVKAAYLLYEQRGAVWGIDPEDKPAAKKDIIDAVVAYLVDYFSAYTAPPYCDRPVGLQEVETILCKWKSHMNGHYPLNNDMNEIREGVKAWEPHCIAAAPFLRALP